MKIFLSALLLLGSIGCYQKQILSDYLYEVKQSDEEITIDGMDDEVIWSKANGILSIKTGSVTPNLDRFKN